MLNTVRSILHGNYRIRCNAITQCQVLSLNRVYLVDSDQGRVVVKIYEKNLFATANKAVHLQNALYEYCGKTVRIIKTIDSNLFVESSDLILFVQEYFQDFTNATLTFEKIYSFWRELTKDIGYILRDTLTVMYERSNENILHSIRALNEAGVSDELLETRRLFAETYSVGYFPQNFGPVHGDFKRGNILVGVHKLIAIDFDNCGKKDVDVEICRAIIEFTYYRRKDFYRNLLLYYKDQFLCDAAIKNYFEYLIASDFPYNVSMAMNPAVKTKIVTERLNHLKFTFLEVKERKLIS